MVVQQQHRMPSATLWKTHYWMMSLACSRFHSTTLCHLYQRQSLLTANLQHLCDMSPNNASVYTPARCHLNIQHLHDMSSNNASVYTPARCHLNIQHLHDMSLNNASLVYTCTIYHPTGPIPWRPQTMTATNNDGHTTYPWQPQGRLWRAIHDGHKLRRPHQWQPQSRPWRPNHSRPQISILWLYRSSRCVCDRHCLSPLVCVQNCTLLCWQVEDVSVDNLTLNCQLNDTCQHIFAWFHNSLGLIQSCAKYVLVGELVTY